MKKTLKFCLAFILASFFYSGAALAASGQIASSAGHDPSLKEAPLILNVHDGERRIRRVMGGALAIIKVDRQNGGSPQLVMGYEEIPVREAIQPHHHPMMDEIIFIHSGSGLACLGSQSAEVQAGGTLFIPRGTRVMLRNTGDVPVAIAYFFSAPGYEEYLRDTSVPEGQEVLPLTAEQLSEIRDQQRSHIVFDEVPATYCSPVLP